MEKVAYIILGSLACVWIGLVIVGMIAAFPFGLLGLLGMGAMGLLLGKVLKERMESKEDDYYDKNIDK